MHRRNWLKGETMCLPRFTADQQQFVVDNLIAMIPHREIAKKFRALYPDFAPEVEDSVYTEAFIKRTADYVANKDRKWAQIIAKGREEQKDTFDHLLLTHKLYRIQVREAVIDRLEEIESQVKRDEIDLKKAKLLMDIALNMTKMIDAYEKSERDYMKLSGRSSDADDWWEMDQYYDEEKGEWVLKSEMPSAGAYRDHDFEADDAESN